MNRRSVMASVLIFLVCFFSASFSAFALEKPFDHSGWDRFLTQFVNDRGEVDYQGVLRDRKLLDGYLETLARVNSLEFENWPREEKLAFWINLYHASLIRLVVMHYPIKTIQNIPGVWELETFRMGAFSYGLNKIQNTELIGQFRDEKIHMALSCGAKGCPRLPREAYTGPKVEGQLFLATKEFVNDSKLNEIVPGQKKIKISRLFKWYQTDFRLDFGTAQENDRGLKSEEFAVLSFLAHYLDDQDKVVFLEEGNFKITYPPFDWSLNEWLRESDTKTSAALPAAK